MNATRVIAGWEYRETVRSRWVIAMAGIFGGLCAVVTMLAFRTVRELGLTGIGPTSATLVNLGVLLPSLMGLLLGAGAIVGKREQGLLGAMAAQPIGRSSIVYGAFVGLTASLWATIGLGFGVAALILSGVVTAGDLPGLIALVGSTFAVAAACVSLGILVSVASTTRLQAVSAVVALWMVLALGMDLALAALAPSIHLGPQGLLLAIALNPLEAGRILALLGTNVEGTALGPFGAYMVGRFGSSGSLLLLSGLLAAWIAVPLMIAQATLRRRDL